MLIQRAILVARASRGLLGQMFTAVGSELIETGAVAADCGFGFSSEELHYYLERTATQFRLMQTRPDFDKVIAA
jgi:hypothetical protein